VRRGQFDAGPVTRRPALFTARRALPDRAGWPAPGLRAGTVPETSAGPASGPGPVLLRLQRQHGNRYVQRVVRQARESAAAANGRRGEGGEIGEPVRAAIEARRGRGQPLDPAADATAGRALGADFGHVRIHADTSADRLCRALNADAFTTGSDIFFRAGQYRPATPAGQKLLAHELTHVRQQQASPSSSPRLRLGPAWDVHERTADQVAEQAASQAASATPSGAPARPVNAGQAPSSAGQRKVFIRKKQLDQLPPAGDAGHGVRSVQSMIADYPSRYFKSEQELYAYANRQTETIGYVDKLKTWVRLNEDELLVLGEKHGPTQPTLPDVASAVGTNRWMYEGYSDVPLWLFTEHARLPTVTSGRNRVWGELAEKRRQGSGHEAESFATKLWRGVAAFDFDDDDPLFKLKTVSRSEWGLLESAIFAGAVSQKYMPGLHEAYVAHKKALEPVLSLGYDQRTDWLDRVPLPAIRKGMTALQKATSYFTHENMVTHPLYERFSAGWHPAKSDYPNKFMLTGDRARDLSMYQNILRAANETYLLYGLGKMHGQRLQDLLNQQGARRKIKYLEMLDFKEQQRKRYPQ
jgi:hypothetical protein